MMERGEQCLVQQFVAEPAVVAYEVQRPALVRALRQRRRSPCSQGSFATAATAHLQALLAMDASELLVVHNRGLPAQQDVQAPVTEPAPDSGKLAKPGGADRHRRAARCDSASDCGLRRSSGTPGAGSPRNLAEMRHCLLAALRQASPFFELSSLTSRYRAWHRPGAASVWRSCPSAAAVPRLPLEKGRAADPVLAANIRRLNLGVMLPQNPDDLFLVKPRSPHRPFSSRGRTLLKSGGTSGTQVTIIKQCDLPSRFVTGLDRLQCVELKSEMSTERGR